MGPRTFRCWGAAAACVVAVAPLAMAATYVQEVSADTPDAWWRLGETSGTTASDATGNGENGTYTNGPSLGVPGAVAGDTAAGLDGIDDYVAIPNFPYRYGNTGSFTVEAWFQTTTGGVIFGYQNTPAFAIPGEYVPALYVDTAGLLRGKFWNLPQIITTAAVNDGVWHHVVIAVSGAGQQTMYLDGAVVGTSSGTLDRLSMTYAQFGTGYTAAWQGGNGGWYSFNGAIDEAAFYGHALSSSRVQAHYLAATAGVEVPEPRVLGLLAIVVAGAAAAVRGRTPTGR
ncbi:MAG: LamG domain-containing protein [Planctomycetota bacterium]|nr:MAG: LamG domain-containing protein [Planctomycetota bacterium]